jgi:hypothetical protein
MASLLRELGVETYLLRNGPVSVSRDDDDNRFFDVPVAEAPFALEDAGAHLRADDVLVVPEVMQGMIQDACSSWKCRVALYNQNGFYSLRFRLNSARKGRRFDFAIANAPYVAGVCETFLGIPSDRVFLVPYWVLREPFRPAEQERRLAVCYMPRKLGEQVEQVRKVVKQAEPNVPWVEIDGIPTAEVARRFRENAVFLSTQHQEGFGLPALEAMACGALVAGYPGTGSFPHPYATASNGLWVRDGDSAAAAAAVCKAIALMRDGGAERDRYLAAGRETVQGYTKDATLKALGEMLRGVAGVGAPSRRRYNLGWRGKLAGLRVLYDSDQLGWPGRVVSWLARKTKRLRSFQQ